MENKREDGAGIAPFMAALLAFIIVFAAASYFVAVVLTNRFFTLEDGGRMIPVSDGAKLPLLIIDAGHGGEDGGAVSGEVLEKDLNLAVSENVYLLCVLTGVPAKPTRRSDTALYSLYSDPSEYSGNKKAYDLRNRVRFVSEEGGGIYLGIHMNKFPEQKYGGFQVWYSKNDPRSEELARNIREGAARDLDDAAGREIKESSGSIYVLDRATVPAALAECGFLSNPDDLSKLTDPEYRRLLAASLFASAAKFAASEAAY